jgi:hypothetical protein
VTHGLGVSSGEAADQLTRDPAAASICGTLSFLTAIAHPLFELDQQ